MEMKMKKSNLVLGALILSSTTFAAQAESNLSVGVDYLNSSNEFTFEMGGDEVKIDDDSDGLRINLGFELSNKKFITLSLQQESYDMGIYDTENNELNSFELGFRKEWAINEYFSPFLRAGANVGMMKIDDNVYDSDYAYAVGGKVGAGISLYATPNIQIIAGVDAQYRYWSQIDTFAEDIDISSTSIIATVGAAYNF